MSIESFKRNHGAQLPADFFRKHEIADCLKCVHQVMTNIYKNYVENKKLSTHTETEAVNAFEKLDATIQTVKKDRNIAKKVTDFFKSVANIFVYLISFTTHSGFFDTTVTPLQNAKASLKKTITLLQKHDASYVNNSTSSLSQNEQINISSAQNKQQDNSTNTSNQNEIRSKSPKFFKVFISDLEGRTYQVNTSSSTSISTLKKDFEEHTGRPLNKLIFSGKRLHDNQTVEECLIDKDSTLYAVGSLSGD